MVKHAILSGIGHRIYLRSRRVQSLSFKTELAFLMKIHRKRDSILNSRIDNYNTKRNKNHIEFDIHQIEVKNKRKKIEKLNQSKHQKQPMVILSRSRIADLHEITTWVCFIRSPRRFATFSPSETDSKKKHNPRTLQNNECRTKNESEMNPAFKSPPSTKTTVPKDQEKEKNPNPNRKASKITTPTIQPPTMTNTNNEEVISSPNAISQNTTPKPSQEIANTASPSGKKRKLSQTQSDAVSDKDEDIDINMDKQNISVSDADEPKNKKQKQSKISHLLLSRGGMKQAQSTSSNTATKSTNNQAKTKTPSTTLFAPRTLTTTDNKQTTKKGNQDQ